MAQEQPALVARVDDLRSAFADILRAAVPLEGAAGGDAAGAVSSTAAVVDGMAASTHRFMDAAKQLEGALDRARGGQAGGGAGAGAGAGAGSGNARAPVDGGGGTTAAATRREIARLCAELLAKDALITKAVARLEHWSGELNRGGGGGGNGGNVFTDGGT